MNIKRTHLPWLAILGAQVGVVVAAAPGNPTALMALGSLFAIAVVGSVRLNLGGNKLLNQIPVPNLPSRGVSTDAREAVERAQRRGGYVDSNITLTDVGLISQSRGRDGVVMRRTRSVSLDDNNLRPYLSLRVEPETADRHALIRFEMRDGRGNEQYVNEMRHYLKDGTINILADHQLRLAGNEHIDNDNHGDWDLRVYIDGLMAAVLPFNVSPSLRERNRRLLGEDLDDGERRARLRDDADDDDDDAPTSLEDLLRSANQQNQRRG